MEARGGRCENCGHAMIEALEFHHRDAATKEFEVAGFAQSLARLTAEIAKCDLVCANCHRLRHTTLPTTSAESAIRRRRELKLRAVKHMGGRCAACGFSGIPAQFEFHHREPREKAFGLAHRGLWRAWDTIVIELAKCVMLCANCHRELHAGVPPAEAAKAREARSIVLPM